jgi:uncharacterized membrane protein
MGIHGTNSSIDWLVERIQMAKVIAIYLMLSILACSSEPIKERTFVHVLDKDTRNCYGVIIEYNKKDKCYGIDVEGDNCEMQHLNGTWFHSPANSGFCADSVEVIR